MLIDILMTLSGFALLVWGADRFVAGASSLASNLGVPPVLIGLTIVGFATSAPEIMVSASAAAQGLTGMAVGNAIGSNIANIGLVLGATALLYPIRNGSSATMRSEIIMLILLTPATALLFLDGSLDRIDGAILVAGVIGFLIWMTLNGLRAARTDPMVSDIEAELDTSMTLGKSLLWLVIGLAILLLGANLLVTGAESLARRFGVSDLIIGLTIVAVGTSLPELAISIISAFKNEQGIAVGNIIGSNVFNLLAVVGVAGLIHPAAMDRSLLALHYPIMIGLTLVLLLITYNPFGKPGFGRKTGLLLLAVFVGYQTMLLTGNG